MDEKPTSKPSKLRKAGKAAIHAIAKLATYAGLRWLVDLLID